MSKKYSHILEPIQIGNVVLKNRLLSSNSLPHFLMGPESFPSDPVMLYQTGLARNGAAIVTTLDWSDQRQRNGGGDGCHFPMFNLKDPSVQNYMNQLSDGIHFYHSKASVAIMPLPPKGYGVIAEEHGPFWPNELPDEPMKAPEGPPPGEAGDAPAGPPMSGPVKQMERPQMDEMIARYVEVAKTYQGFGFDMITIHMSYNATVLAQFLSPLKNKRTDAYGGSVENRTRFPLELCRAIKAACGQDFLIEAQISGEEEPGGITIADTVEFAKLAEGIIDIFQIRAGDGDLNHPTGFNSDRTPITLRVAEAIKKSGAKVVTAPIGGFQNPDDMEAYLAQGKTDMIAAARAFFCDPSYYEKIVEGRGEDVVPCIRCNRCHGQGMAGPWLSVCSVNPTLGLGHKLERMVDQTPKRSKKVAVIGGGPAGMQAAITAASRGHAVTLYEKADRLGGQILHADYASFKWPILDFKNYQIRQLDKLGVSVKLKTAATPDMIAAEGYDAVLVALGAVPNLPPIEGVSKEAGVFDPISVYGQAHKLGRRVVVIGGSEIGTETGLYLAGEGHEVTVLTRQRQLAPESERVHYYTAFQQYWETQESFRYILRAAATRVEAGKVWYRDADGEEYALECDSVVACGGMKSAQEEALSFSGSGDEVFLIGDCDKVGNIQKAVRAGYSAAAML